MRKLLVTLGAVVVLAGVGLLTLPFGSRFSGEAAEIDELFELEASLLTKRYVTRELDQITNDERGARATLLTYESLFPRQYQEVVAYRAQHGLWVSPDVPPYTGDPGDETAQTRHALWLVSVEKDAFEAWAEGR